MHGFELFAAFWHQRHPHALQVLGTSADGFALVDVASHQVVGLWAGMYSRPIELDGKTYYRLDYMESAPGVAGVGLYLWAAICQRAEELGCGAVVFGAVRGADKPHRSRGAQADVPKAWNVASGLHLW